jgi:serine/threonine-protein kinase
MPLSGLSRHPALLALACAWSVAAAAALVPPGRPVAFDALTVIAIGVVAFVVVVATHPFVGRVPAVVICAGGAIAAMATIAFRVRGGTWSGVPVGVAPMLLAVPALPRRRERARVADPSLLEAAESRVALADAERDEVQRLLEKQAAEKASLERLVILMTGLPGEFLARYRVRTDVEPRSGAHGAVLVANRVSDDAMVAIKLVRYGANLAEQHKRLSREIDALRGLRHPSIVPVLDAHIDTAASTIYMVTPFATQGTLDDLIASAISLDARRAAAIALCIVEALMAMHDPKASRLPGTPKLSLIHRDVKPSNVLLGIDSAAAMLADLSLVFRPDGGDSRLTATSDRVGTWPYAPLEQFTEELVGPEADVHALAATIYQMFTGAKPYQRERHARRDVRPYERIMLEGAYSPAPMQAENRAAPTELAALVDRGLSRVPSRRPSLEEFRRVLKRLTEASPPPPPIPLRELRARLDPQPPPATQRRPRP